MYKIPNESAPVAVVVAVYGNNASVACPCGKLSVVRSLGSQGGGTWTCACARRYKGYPENGASITHLLVWEALNAGQSADHLVSVEVARQ